MSEETIVVISGMAGVAACIIYNIFVYVFITNRKKRFVAKAKKKGHYVTANYVSHVNLAAQRDSGTHTQFRRAAVTYEYIVKDKKYKKKYVYSSEGSATVNFPYSLKIYYKGINPKKSISENESTEGKVTIGCLTSIIVLGVVIRLCMKFLGAIV